MNRQITKAAYIEGVLQSVADALRPIAKTDHVLRPYVGSSTGKCTCPECDAKTVAAGAPKSAPDVFVLLATGAPTVAMLQSLVAGLKDHPGYADAAMAATMANVASGPLIDVSELQSALASGKIVASGVGAAVIAAAKTETGESRVRVERPSRLTRFRRWVGGLISGTPDPVAARLAQVKKGGPLS